MDTDNPMKQSKLWSNRCTAVGGTKYDKTCTRVTIGVGFTSDWMRKCCEFLKTTATQVNAALYVTIYNPSDYQIRKELTRKQI